MLRMVGSKMAKPLLYDLVNIPESTKIDHKIQFHEKYVADYKLKNFAKSYFVRWNQRKKPLSLKIFMLFATYSGLGNLETR